jgi:uncharacterized protein YegJ (DUF2314 family)
MTRTSAIVAAPVLKENLELAKAIEAARTSLPQFIESFRHPARNQSAFQLKVAFEAGDLAEEIWITHLKLEGNRASGLIATANSLPGFHLGDRVSFDLRQVTDWMYTEDFGMVGGFTTRALLRMRVKASMLAHLQGHPMTMPRIPSSLIH